MVHCNDKTRIGATLLLLALLAASWMMITAAGCLGEKNNPAVLNSRAREAEEAGRLEEAVRLLQESLAQRPAQPAAMISLGRVQYYLGRPEAAAGAYRKALELEPGSLEAMTGLGLSLLAQRQDQEALDLFNRVLLTAPKSPRALY